MIKSFVVCMLLLPTSILADVKVESIEVGKDQAAVRLGTSKAVSNLEVVRWRVEMEGRVLVKAKDGHWRLKETAWRPILTANNTVLRMSRTKPKSAKLEKRKSCVFELRVTSEDGRTKIEKIKVVVSSSRYRTATSKTHGAYSDIEPNAPKAGWVEVNAKEPIPSDVVIFWKERILFKGPVPRL